MTIKLSRWAGLCAGLLLSGVAVSAQQRPDGPPPMPREDRVMIFSSDAPPPMGGPQQDTFVFVGMEGRGQKTVKGAPYSAEAVTESIQTLADGNRIVRNTKALVYRDSEGRTRREQSIKAIGPWASGDEPARFISIFDPVAGVNYTLNPRTKTATKMTVGGSDKGFTFTGPGGGFGEAGQTRVIVRSDGDGPMPPLAPMPPPPPGEANGAIIQREEVRIITHGAGGPNKPQGDKTKGNLPEPRKEDLGTRSIEGVNAQGTRVTMTFPAGFFGNERPIEVVSEKWYSPELQTVVLTKHSDPRQGETTFRLTNINRSNPDKGLFEVPADFKVNERQEMRREMRMRPDKPQDKQ